jgi:vesicle-fusing ATPase
LNCAEPKIVNGPEILNKFVGQSEENIRNLFAEAEKEYQEKQDASQLHLIIFDEIDAICKQRGSTRSGTGVNDSVVNQLLSKIDGVNSLNNILVIGMTNRLDMLDEALLRPGRFEVQVEIGLPDEKGRKQILNIHTKKMNESGYLDKNVDIDYLSKKTKNFSGAEIVGLVNSASSFALNRLIDINNVKKINYEELCVTMGDFEGGLEEVKPAFGVSTDEFEQYTQDDLVSYGKRFETLMNTCKSFVEQVEKNDKTNLISLLLEGEVGCGKTSLAANIALKANFPFMKIITTEKFIGHDERSKCDYISKVFNDAYKSPLSIIVLDNLERLIEYVNIGPRFSNAILQTLLVLIRKKPPKNRKLLVIGTTSMKTILEDMELIDSFNVTLHIPLLKDKDEIKAVLLSSEAFEEGKVLEDALKISPDFLPIKKLLMVIEMARSKGDGEKKITLETYEQSLFDVGYI